MLFLEKKPDLNETDLIIYKYVVANMSDIPKMSIRELADSTHTSTASVLRFCKKFNSSGFSEFKIHLNTYLDSLNREENFKSRDLENELLSFLARAKNHYFEDKIEESVHLLMEKELIVFIGLGSSNIVAEYGALYFSSLFTMAIRIEDPNNYPINYLPSELAKRMCVVVLSVSGETSEIINYINHLNLSESSIIVITSSESSPLGRLADIAISYNVLSEKIDDADVTTQIPAIYIIEKLAKSVRQMMIQDSEINREE